MPGPATLDDREGRMPAPVGPGRRDTERFPMVTPTGATIRIATPLMLAAGLIAMAAPFALGATPLCQVRNVSQETSGRSLIRMVGKAHDGDRLRVRGACSGEVVIHVDILIRGAGHDATLTGRDETRALRVPRGTTVRVQDLVIERGYMHGHGGAIQNAGTLRLTNVIVQDSKADHILVGTGDGGGIHSRGRLIVVDSILRRNSADQLGGGLVTRGPRGHTTLRRTVVARNRATNIDEGGGLANQAGSSTTLIDSTVRGNRGGAIANSGTLELVRSAVRRNRNYVGGGISNFRPGLVLLDDSVVSGNTATGEGAGGIFNSGTVRLMGSRVKANTARGDAGGGIWNLGEVTLIGSTIGGNTAGTRGGGIYNTGGTVELADSTVSANTASTGGGGIWNGDGPGDVPGVVTLDGASSVTGNTPDDCVGTPAC